MGVAGALAAVALLGGCDLRPASEAAVPAVEAVPIDVAPGDAAPAPDPATRGAVPTPDRDTPEKRQPENGTTVGLTSKGASR